MNELASRQKKYEDEYNIIIKGDSPFLIRLDGKGFSKQIKHWKCEKPFDKYFHEAMLDATEYLMNEIAEIKLAWTGSDEITLLFDSKSKWYNNRINKLLSLTAAYASVKFNQSMISNLNNNVNQYPAVFDSRIITPPNIAECLNNFIYRQRDCIRNSISMWFGHFYSHKQAMAKNSDEKIKQLKEEKQFDWNIDAPAYTKYGTLFYYTKVTKVSPDNTAYIRNVLNKSYDKFTFNYLQNALKDDNE